MKRIPLEHMAGFWLGLICIPALIYAMYQVSKKRLHHMGYTARPFWILLFLLILLFVGLALYFGWGEYFNLMFDNVDKHDDEAWIKAQEKVLEESLAKGMPTARVVLMIPTTLFVLWLAAMPGNDDADS